MFLPACVVLAATTLGPFAWATWLSLTDFNLSRLDSGRFVGLATYVDVLTDPPTRGAIVNSLYLAVATVSIESVSGLGMALLLARPFRGVRLARSLFLAPLMTTPVVVALTWRMLLNARFGYVNYFLGLVGAPQPDWLGNPMLAMPALVLADVWVATPFMGTLLLAGLLSLPEEPFEAARIDGASSIQMLWHITLPLLRPVLAVAIMLRAVDAFRKFESIQIMTGGGPGDVTTTLNFLAYTTGFVFLRLAHAAALAVLMVGLMLLVVIACMRWLQGARA